MSPEPRRLHRAGIAVYAFNTLREAALPLIVVLAVSAFGGGMDETALMRGFGFMVLGVALSIVLGVARWRTTTWWVADDAIHHKSGVVSLKETDVPLARIQSLDLEQGPVQRLFSVFSVHVQTGGGGAKGEIKLDAVGPDVVRELRALLTDRPAEEVATHPEPDAERRLTRPRLLLAALTAGQLGVILPLLAGAGQLLQSSFDEEDAVRLLPHTVTAAVLAAIGIVVLAWLLSVIGSVVAFAGFTATRDGDRLRIRRGLLARREATVPVERVRAVEVVEGVLRLPFGLAAVRMEVIGHAKEAAAAQMLFPLLRREEVRPFLDELLPELADDLEGLEPPPARAARRYALPPAVAGAVVVAAGWAFTPVGPWGLPLVAVLAGYGLLRYRAAGWRLEGGRLAVRSLVLARTTVLGPAYNREWHQIGQNVLQRRARLADVFVAFGKQTGARVRHLELTTAAAVYERLSAASPSSRATGGS
ncbi:MAG TPA: PH domain-containing protein [Solirubrobacteraceae bacterium]|nr:PH domain-containing protein [Solirubrobacteraceae bacterium]